MSVCVIYLFEVVNIKQAEYTGHSLFKQEPYLGLSASSVCYLCKRVCFRQYPKLVLQYLAACNIRIARYYNPCVIKKVYTLDFSLKIPGLSCFIIGVYYELVTCRCTALFHLVVDSCGIFGNLQVLASEKFINRHANRIKSGILEHIQHCIICNYYFVIFIYGNNSYRLHLNKFSQYSIFIPICP